MDTLKELVDDFIKQNKNTIYQLKMKEHALYMFDHKLYSGVLEDIVAYHAVMYADKWSKDMRITKMTINNVPSIDSIMDSYTEYINLRKQAEEAYQEFRKKVSID